MKSSLYCTLITAVCLSLIGCSPQQESSELDQNSGLPYAFMAATSPLGQNLLDVTDINPHPLYIRGITRRR